MAAIRSVRPVNLICGLISDDPDLMTRAIQLLSKHAGPTDLVIDLCPFDMTDYYETEMGSDLQRRFVSFERLIQPGELVAFKQITNDLEECLIRDCAMPAGMRPVNLDPGYLTLSKLVLATTKDFSHRLFLGGGIYAESTLHYEGGGWIPWPWTYPDYVDGRYFPFLDQVRDGLKVKLTAEPAPPQQGRACL